MTSRNPAGENADGPGPSGPHDDGLGVSPGDVLGGKYRVEALIGEGGMGIVLRATHLDLDCPVAIKLIRPEHAANEDVVARLLAEARVAASLRSKHVNRVLDVGRTDQGTAYLVLEYMEGRDLGGHLSQVGRLPLRDAVSHVLQACEALAEAHALGIVHRDLKPENLFLSEDTDGGLVLKILDFGISKAPAASRRGRTLTNPFEVVGSPMYMSPEQIRGTTVDARSDIWALGVVLYELCTGEMLFDSPTVTEGFAKILDESFLVPALELGPASAALERVIARCLRRNAGERYRDVAELAAELAPLGSDPLQAARVAKISVAARARAIATVCDPKLGVSMATPFALTMAAPNAFEPDVARSRPRAWWRWTLLGAAAAAPLLLGLAYWPSSTEPETGVDSRRAAAAPGALAHEVEPVTSVVAVTKDEPPAPPALSPLPASPSAPAPAAAKPQPVRFKVWPLPSAPAVLLRASTPSPAPVPDSPPPSNVVATIKTDAAPVPTSTATSDAWDPKTFGGRR